MLIPDAVWAEKGPALLANPEERLVVEVAEQLGISPAILSGRIRWELRDYTILASLVGNGEARRLFPDLYKP
jgi:HTH-type transcriptional regulator/antitoxin HigA